MNTEEILEPFTKFSESLIWKLQEEAYTRFGPSAWSEKGVPFYVTNSAWTAHAFVKTVQGFFRNLSQQGVKGCVYIFDLGAGTGRLGYLFLKMWKKELFPTLSLRYIMTDIVEANINFLNQHLLLQPFIKEGLLDFAIFRPDQKEKELNLRISQEKLDHLNAPVILFANYFFDTIPQELYKVENGQLYQGMIALKASQSSQDRLDPARIPKMRYEFRYDLLSNWDSHWKDLLEEHIEKLSPSKFLFPIGALQTLDFFRRLTSNKPLLLLAQDQAIVRESHWKVQEDPGLSIHGTFSLIVSYYSIKRYFERLGGKVLLPDCPSMTLTTLGALLAQEPEWKELENAYRDHIGFFDPMSFRTLVSACENQIQTLRGLVMLIRVGRADPMILHAHYQAIRQTITTASEDDKRDLLTTILQSADHFYPVGANDANFLMDLGVLCFDLKAFDQALQLFSKAHQLGCRHEQLPLNIILCSQLASRNLS